MSRSVVLWASFVGLYDTWKGLFWRIFCNSDSYVCSRNSSTLIKVQESKSQRPEVSIVHVPDLSRRGQDLHPEHGVQRGIPGYTKNGRRQLSGTIGSGGSSAASSMQRDACFTSHPSSALQDTVRAPNACSTCVDD